MEFVEIKQVCVLFTIAWIDLNLLIQRGFASRGRSVFLSQLESELMDFFRRWFRNRFR